MTKYSINYFVKTAGAFLFCLIAHIIHAEKYNIDSLKNGLKDASVFEKIKTNYLLGTQFFGSSPDSAMHY
jgi:hypothetical protein